MNSEASPHQEPPDKPSVDPDAYRLRAQVCPRGCEFTETARRELIAKTRFGSFGRTRLSAEHRYESSNCPKCGALLIGKCARCGNSILAPVGQRCTSCGLPHPWAAERRSGLAQQPVRKWRKGEEDVNDPATPVYQAKRGEVLALDGDILRLKIDAIISNDDVDGQMWTEIAHGIRTRGGGEIERLARVGAPRPIGQAWITPAGELPAKAVIHVASMNRRGASNDKWVGECLREAFALAENSDEIGSLGVATINSGPSAIPLPDWIKVFAEACVAHLHPSNLEQEAQEGAPEAARLEVLLVLYAPSNFEVSLDELREGLHAAWCAVGRPADGEVLGPLPKPQPQPRWVDRFVRWLQRTGEESHDER